MEKIWLKHYPENIPAEVNVDEFSSLVEIFQKSCEKFADRPAFSNFGCRLTYRELKQKSQEFAGYLYYELGLRKGDRIALMMPNVLQYPVAMFGALQAGLVVVNVNPLYTTRELVHQLNDSGAETIVVLANFAHVVEAALPQTSLKHIIVTEMGDLFPWMKGMVINGVVKYIKKMIPKFSLPTAVSFKQVLQLGKKHAWQPIEITSQDLAFLQYTGGTTGVAKGAELTHRNMVANLQQIHAWISTALREGEDVVITALPLYHIFSLTANCLTFLKLGAFNILITNPRDIRSFIQELKKVPFTVMTGVNTLFNALLRRSEFVQLDFHSLRFVMGGGMAVQQVVANKWKEITGVPLLEGYGLTETAPVVSAQPLLQKEHREGIGYPLPSTEVKICDEEGNELPVNQPGELCVRGPQVMRGYWQRPDETQKVFFEGGWLRTGDIAVIEPDGWLRIIDRKKDMILVSGFNVYPNEVEDVLVKLSGIAEAAVIGVPDPKGAGEIVKAFVVKEDPALDEAAILQHCRQYLTAYKMPKQIEFRTELPKTNVGKILRRALRDEHGSS